MKRPLAALLCVALSAASGCRKHRAIDDPPPTPPRPQPPVDSTLPGELAEGKEQAFGVPLPRVMRVTGRFPEMVLAAGPAAPVEVANFFRSRVKAEKIETGPVKTVFSNVTVKSQPDAGVMIEVYGTVGQANVMVRSSPRPKPDDSSSPAERMRRIGLNPDGTLADPTQLR